LLAFYPHPPPPPLPTPSPYTTLFRSCRYAEPDAEPEHHTDYHLRHHAGGNSGHDVLHQLAADIGSPLYSPGVERIYRHDCPPLPDRKSTRLNSSHVSTSYAASCLQKT